MRSEEGRAPEVKVLASESLGVRAFALKVDTGRGVLLVDPCVALAPRVEGLPPAPEELQAFIAAWERIREALASARWVAFTHYHHDHQVPYMPLAFPEPPPHVFLKSPEDTNRSQKARADLLIRALEERNIPWSIPQGKTLSPAPDVSFWFSPSLFHGMTPRLGTVMMVGVESSGRRMLYTSDIQGPVREDHLEAILSFAPQVLFLDPPMAPGGKMPDVFFTHMEKLFHALPSLEVLVVDHHPLRDALRDHWWSPLEALAIRYGVRLTTGAGWNGERERLLEAHRPNLWKTHAGGLPW